MYLHDFIDKLDYVFSLEKEQDRFVAICIIAGMQQKEIARMLCVSQPYVSKIIKKIKKGYKK